MCEKGNTPGYKREFTRRQPHGHGKATVIMNRPLGTSGIWTNASNCCLDISVRTRRQTVPSLVPHCWPRPKRKSWHDMTRQDTFISLLGACLQGVQSPKPNQMSWYCAQIRQLLLRDRWAALLMCKKKKRNVLLWGGASISHRPGHHHTPGLLTPHPFYLISAHYGHVEPCRTKSGTKGRSSLWERSLRRGPERQEGSALLDGLWFLSARSPQRPVIFINCPISSYCLSSR